MSRAREEIMELARSFSLSTEFPDAVMAEVQRCLAAPGLDDPALVDATDRPFVTIDNEDSRDLDQALFIEARGDGHVVHYALADASYYVRPGSRLYAEALVRGASFYLPGFVAPMLPVELSEGLVSLNPEVERRAVVFVVELDNRGEVASIRIERQRIRSRAKLSYIGVQRFWDSPASDHLENRDFTASLWALREVGRRRIALAEAGGVVHYPRIEVDIGFTDVEGRRFHVFESHRTECDRANEQLSLLVNVEGARLLERVIRDTGDPNITAVYRVHPAPASEALAALAVTSRRILEHHGLSADLAWAQAEGELLSRWLARLAAALGRHPVVLALQRQALLVNQRSTFAPEPGLHYGVGAPCYARFSSPMREVVGIHTHREALEALGLEPMVAVAENDRAAIVAAANRSKNLQHTLTQRANQLVLASLLSRDLEHSLETRPRRSGTVMGVAKDRLFVLLETPPLDLKVYTRDLGEARYVDDSLIVDGVTFALGDRVEVRVERFDTERDRFALSATLGVAAEGDTATLGAAAEGDTATLDAAERETLKGARP